MSSSQRKPIQPDNTALDQNSTTSTANVSKSLLVTNSHAAAGNTSTPQNLNASETPQEEDKKNNELPVTSPKTPTHGFEFFRPASYTEYDHNSQLHSNAEIQAIEEREKAYNHLRDIMKKTRSFEDNAQLSADNALLNLLNKLTNGLKKKDDSLTSQFLKNYKDEVTAIQTKSIATVNDRIHSVSPKLGKADKKLYAETQAARAIMPNILNTMLASEEILSALKKVYTDRDTQDPKRDPKKVAAIGPALLCAKMQKTSKTKDPEHFCMISLSGSEVTNPAIKELYETLRIRLENISPIVDETPYKISISSRISDDFQSLITKTLNDLDEKAKLLFSIRIRDMLNKASNTISEEKELKILMEKISNFLLPKPNKEEKQNSKEKSCSYMADQIVSLAQDYSCVKQHNDSANKNCAEKPFISDYAKALLHIGLNEEDQEELHLDGMDCVNLSFNRIEEKAEQGYHITVEVPQKTHRQYLYRPGMTMDPNLQSENPAVSEKYLLECLAPCDACTINKPMVIALFTAIAEFLKTHKQDDDVMQIHNTMQKHTTATPITPQKQRIKNLIKTTPMTASLNEILSPSQARGKRAYKGRKLVLEEPNVSDNSTADSIHLKTPIKPQS